MDVTNPAPAPVPDESEPPKVDGAADTSIDHQAPPVPDAPEPSKSDGVADKLIDRLPERFSPRWIFATIGLLLLTVVALAYVAGVVLAAVGGAVGLAAILGEARKKP